MISCIHYGALFQNYGGIWHAVLRFFRIIEEYEMQLILVSVYMHTCISYSMHALKDVHYCSFFLIFSCLYIEKILFWGQIFEVEILMDGHILRSRESEKHIFSVSSVCVSVISITQKQITAESSNVVLYICITGRCYLKHFIKIEQKLCVQGHTKEF